MTDFISFLVFFSKTSILWFLLSFVSTCNDRWSNGANPINMNHMEFAILTFLQSFRQNPKVLKWREYDELKSAQVAITSNQNIEAFPLSDWSLIKRRSLSLWTLYLCGFVKLCVLAYGSHISRRLGCSALNNPLLTWKII